MNPSEADREIRSLECRYHEFVRVAQDIRALLQDAREECSTDAGRLSLTARLTHVEREMAAVLVRIGNIEDSLLE
jgi:hypothetical protein